jgi:putative ABC transport system permease protein
LFQALLRVFPFDFQREYGKDMQDLFRDQRYEIARNGGFMDWMKLWARTIVGVVRTAPREHVDVLQQDIRYAIRALLRTPVYTVVAVLTLTLAIGANTAVFSVVNGVMLRPFPYPNIDRLVGLMENNENNGEPLSISYPNFTDWYAQNTVFEKLGLYRGQTFNLTGTGQPERLSGGIASSGLFDATGLKPIAGRTFTPDEDQPGAPAVAIISERLWTSRFAAEPATLGRNLTLNGVAYAIVGIMPGGMRIPSRLTDVWLPIGRYVDSFPPRGAHPGLYGMGRLKPGVSFERAVNEMNTIADRLSQEYPNSNQYAGILMTPYYEQVVSNIRPALMMLFITVVLVLLIACANLGNLMLARADARQREIAVRTSLGASRWRIVRQLSTESLLIASIGAVLGVILAKWAIASLVASNPSNIPRLDQVYLDARVLAFAVAAAVSSALVFGLLPSLRLARNDLQVTIKDGGRGSGGFHSGRLRGVFVVAEVALALVILTGAGLTIRSFRELTRVDTGFQADNVITANVALPDSKYPQVQTWTAFYSRLLERVGALPGVTSAAINSGLPMTGVGNESPIMPEGRPMPKPGEPMQGATFFAISPDYFATLGIRILHGRSFTREDTSNAPLVAIIDEKVAKLFWPNESAIGKRVAFEAEGMHGGQITATWREVVGVVQSVRHYGLTVDSKRVQIYTPFTQIPLYMRDRRPTMALAVKTDLPQQTMIAQIRQELSAIDRDLPLFAVSTMDAVLSQQFEQPRLSMALMSLFGVLALILAILGVYGVMSYTVLQRTQEIGIRMALGARRADVLLLVVRRAVLLVGAGLIIGAAAGFALNRSLPPFLYQVSPDDPTTLIVMSILLAAIALIASFIPARRATRVDPIRALRYE